MSQLRRYCMHAQVDPARLDEYRRRHADETAGIPSCHAQQVSRPIRNREA